MATPVIMPRQGQSVESCIFTEWYVKVGEKVSKGELLFAYETDKAAFEGEAPEEGLLLAVFAQPGEAIPVLQNIAVIGRKGENIHQYDPRPSGIQASPDIEPVAGTAGSSPIIPQSEVDTVGGKEKIMTSAISGKPSIEPGTKGDKVKISPRARKAAERFHVNYASITGSGPEGRIIERDILERIKSRPKATPLAKSVSYQDHIDLPERGTGSQGKVVATDVKIGKGGLQEQEYEDQKITNIRRIIAENMHGSLKNTAQLTLHTSADARGIKALRSRYKEESEAGHKPNVTINDLVCHAAVQVLVNHREMNAHFLGDTLRQFKQVHLGFAVDTDRGLMVPTLRNANQLNLEDFSVRLKELAAQAQSGKINPELLTGATFTITNLGAFGIEVFTPVLNPPQIGILGVNTIGMHPSVLEDGSFGFIPKIGLSLTFDHRAIDGAPAAAFLRDVSLEIEHYGKS